MKLFITGSSGFVGFHVAKFFLISGFEIHLLIRSQSAMDRINKLPGKPHVHVHDGSSKHLNVILKSATPDAILHIAAHVKGDHNVHDIEPLFRSNILFGAQLVDAAVRNGVQYFINTGTFWQHFHGDHYNPTCLYAATKQAFEDIITYYIQAYDFRSFTLKLFDTYGPDDPRHKLFYLLRKSYLTGEPLSMSPGNQLIDLVYIDDVVAAYHQAVTLIKKSDLVKNGTSFAVSSKGRIRLKDVVELYCKVTRKKIAIKWGGKPYRPREVMDPWTGDTLPGWKPETDLESGIRLMEKAP